jgi:predicted permease
MLKELRYTLRSLRGMRSLAMAAIGCIALGTGGAVFILTVANGVLRRDAPFPDADRLVRIWTVREGTGEQGDLSYLDARDIRESAGSFDAIEMAARTRAAVTTELGTERLRGESVTPGYFGAIALRPALGRVFTAGEYDAAAPRVMMIGHGLWLRLFGGDPGIIGRTVRARGSTGSSGEADQLFTVVGVMPPGFSGTVDPDHSEFWLPIDQYTPRMVLERRSSRAVWVLARLRAGTSIAAARREVAEIGRRLAQRHPADYRELSLGIEPLGETWRSRFRAGLTVLTAAAALLLMIACTNVSYLLLARLAQREHEMRLRVALGARHHVIAGQVLLECLVLTVAGGLLGTLLAVWGVKLVVSAKVFSLPPYVTLAVDAQVVAVIVGLLGSTAVVSGALPALWSARLNAAHQLRDAGRGTTLGRRQRLTIDGLVAAEVAFSFVLLVASALMVRSYANLLRSDPGFRTERLQRMAITLDPREFPSADRQLAFAREARTALAAHPGVAQVSLMAGVLPPWFDPEVPLAVGGVSRTELSAVRRHSVDERFFDVMSIPLLAGRAFTSNDDADAPPAAIVGQSVARALAGGDGLAVVGRTIGVVGTMHDPTAITPVEIVGVTADVRYNGPRGANPRDHDVYLPIAQSMSGTLSIAITTSVDPATLLPSFRRTLTQLAPTSPLHWISTMEEEQALQFGDARLYAWLTGVFGATALLLVMLGIYSVIANAVARRLAELSVRIAVGARPVDIIGLVLSQATRPLALGVGVGAVVAAAGLGVARTLVYGMELRDPATFAVVGLLLVLTGIAASYFPARRAARVDPNTLWRG